MTGATRRGASSRGDPAGKEAVLAGDLLLFVIVASIALVDTDAGLDPVSRSRSVMTGPSVRLSN